MYSILHRQKEKGAIYKHLFIHSSYINQIAVHFPELLRLQGDQLNIAVFFWYLVNIFNIFKAPNFKNNINIWIPCIFHWMPIVVNINSFAVVVE